MSVQSVAAEGSDDVCGVQYCGGHSPGTDAVGAGTWADRAAGAVAAPGGLLRASISSRSMSLGVLRPADSSGSGLRQTGATAAAAAASDTETAGSGGGTERGLGTTDTGRDSSSTA